MVLGTLLCNRYFICQGINLVKPEYFRSEIHQVVCKTLFTYFEEYKQQPSKIFLRELIDEFLKKRYQNQEDTYRAIRLIYQTEINLIYDYYIKGGNSNIMMMVDSPEAILDKITSFAKTQAIKIAFAKSVDLIRRNPEADETFDKIDLLYKEARLVNRNIDMGLNYFETLEDRYIRIQQNIENAETFTSGFRAIDNGLMGGGLVRGEMGAWMGAAGTGKCTIRGTKILMYDGTVKNCEDVLVGDLVMGNDSTPRRVLHTHSLIDQVYEVKPVKGESYFVNSKHILSLKRSSKKPTKRNDRPTKIRKNVRYHNHFSRMGDTNIFNISVEEWLKESKSFKKCMKGWRVGIEWDAREVKIDPYFLGLWLGDGHKNTSAVTNVDDVVVEEVKKTAAKRSLSVRIKDGHDYFIFSKDNKVKIPGKGVSKNSLLNDLRHYNLINNKHIPFDYKINSRASRLKLLAGLIDTDGYNHKCGGYDFIQKNKTLAKDVLFLARSLGFAAYMRRCVKKCQTGNGGYYWRISISGDCSQIPVRIKYKKCEPRKQTKNHLVTGIRVIKHNKSAEFYGFEIDGNHLFLLSDFTVVHNSLALTWASACNIEKGKKVLYISTEMDPDRIATRFDAQLTHIGHHQLILKKEEVWRALRNTVSEYEDKRRLIIKQFPSGSADMSTIKAYYAQITSLGFRPDLVIFDYPGDMKDNSNLAGWDSRFRLLREIRGFGVEEKHCTLIAVHPNRSISDLGLEEFMDEKNQGDSFKQFQIFDAFWTLNQTPAENKANVGRGFVAKARNGKSKYSFKIRYHFEDQTLRLEEIPHQAYMGHMTKAQEADADHTETVIDKVSVGKKKFEPKDGERIG
jgi:replicative DNA helicase